jgi:hypothetical protein
LWLIDVKTAVGGFCGRRAPAKTDLTLDNSSAVRKF